MIIILLGIQQEVIIIKVKHKFWLGQIIIDLIFNLRYRVLKRH